MKIEETGRNGYLVSATAKELGTICFALRVVEDIFPETESAPMAADIAKTIRDRAEEETNDEDFDCAWKEPVE